MNSLASNLNLKKIAGFGMKQNSDISDFQLSNKAEIISINELKDLVKKVIIIMFHLIFKIKRAHIRKQSI